jgi:hypothetical protein
MKAILCSIALLHLFLFGFLWSIFPLLFHFHFSLFSAHVGFISLVSPNLLGIKGLVAVVDGIVI